MKKFSTAVCIAAAAVLLLSGCGGSGNSDSAPAATTAAAVSEAAQAAPSAETQAAAADSGKTAKSEFVIALQSEPASLDPHKTTDTSGFIVETQIFNSLVEKKEDGTIVPCLASSWEVVDSVTVRFTLRDDVYFQNGEKMTAEDVQYSLVRACTESGSASHFKNLDPEKITVVDDKTVEVVTKKPFSSLFNYLSSTRGSILPKKAVEEMGDDFARNPIGTGAFMMDSWETGTAIKLAKNDKFWGEAPSYNDLKIRFISEAATRSIELETGMVDAIFNPATVDTDRMKGDDNFNVIIGPGYGQMQALFNLSNPAIQDIRVREALAYALDVPALVKVVYGEYAVPATSVMSSAIACYHEIGVQEYDPEKSKALLAEAGYPDGLTLDLNIMNTQEAQDTAEILQSMWGQVGITVNINMSSAGDFIDSCFRGETTLMASAASFATGDPAHALSDYVVSNSGALCLPQDTKVDEMVDEAALTFDETERAAKYAEIQEYIHDQYYMIPLADKEVVYITGKNVEDFPCYANGLPYLANVKVYEK